MLCFRVVIFCVLVCLLLYVLFSYIHKGSIEHLMFHKSYKDDQNGQVVFEHVSNNYLRERLVGLDVNMTDLTSFVNEDAEFKEIISVLKKSFNVHDPRSRNEIEDEVESAEVSESGSVEFTTEQSKVTAENLFIDSTTEVDSNGTTIL